MARKSWRMRFWENRKASGEMGKRGKGEMEKHPVCMIMWLDGIGLSRCVLMGQVEAGASRPPDLRIYEA
jgi:hypothetical protein